MQITVAILVTSLMAVGVSPAARADDTVEIYALALRAAARSDATPRRRMAVAAATIVNAKMWEDLPDRFHPRSRSTYASRDAVEAYLVASASSTAVPTNLGRNTEFALFPLKQLLDAWSGSSESFRRRHRLVGGYAEVSQIGFNHDRSEALLYVDYFCGGLCGSGSLVYLERRGQMWQVIKVDQVYMS